MRRMNLDPRSWLGSSVTDPPILIVRLDFTRTPTLLAPIRFIPNRPGIISGGFVYEEIALNTSVPDEGDKQVPRTAIEMSNVDKRFMPFLHANLLAGTRVSLRMVQESAPEIPVFEINMDVEGATADDDKVTFNVGYSDLLDVAGVRLLYNRRGAPALFE